MAYENTATIMHGVSYVSKKRIANNTVRYVREDGATVWRLHHTDIVTKLPDGSFVLNSGGWKTPTTKDRISQYAPVSLRSDRGIWYMGNVPFFDGVRVDAAGRVLNAAEGPPLTDTHILKRKIARFVKLIDTCETLPTPNGGDCWVCMFNAPRRIEQGARCVSPTPLSDDTDHLMSHMDEGYLHGTLLVNAMRYAGYSDDGIGLWYQMRDRAVFKRALRRYLNRSFGLAV